MSRRLTAATALAVLGVAVLPAVPAFASASSTATITAGKAVYPGADRTFTIRVTNTESPLLGKTINAIRVNFPVNEANIGVTGNPGTAPGFTGTTTDLGSTEFITYRGGSLRPGMSLDITFPATVGAPLGRDLLGDFRVQVSSDDFASNKNAGGDLVTKVQVLEILQEGLRPVEPTNADGSKGVTDRTGTAGQAITYGSTIKNHARSPLTVTAGLTSPAGDTATPTSISVPAGGTAEARIPVQLGAAAADRSTVFTATATAPGSEAPSRSDSFRVQAPATLTFSDLQPTRTTSGVGSGRDFSAAATKGGTPALDLTSSTLTFGSNSATATEKPTFPSGTSNRRMTYSFTSISGSDGELAAAITNSATDDNLATYSPRSDLGNIVIDNLAPVVDVLVGLPKDFDGMQQVAVKDGDSISVSGTIRNAGDMAANSLKVVLQPNVGDPVTVPVTMGGSGDERTYSGSASPDWAEGATTFFAKTEIKDTAGNTGSAQSASTVIDNVLPGLVGDGVVLEPRLIEVNFDDATGVAGGCNPNQWTVAGTPGSVTEVRTADGTPCEELGTGSRLLVLRNALGVDDTPPVTYEAPNRVVVSRPAKDGAANTALRQTVDTVTNLIPLKPGIVTVERRDGAPDAGFESAYRDTDNGAYYTNVPGAQALRLTVSGIRQNYTVEVLRGSTTVASQKFTAAPPLLASEYSGSVLVPVPATDTLYGYSVRFISARGNRGPTADFSVVLDRVVPGLGGPSIAVGAEESTVTVPFTEKIVRGTDFSDDWFVSETIDTETGTARRTVNANSVTGSDQTSRALQVTLRDPSRFAGVDYFLQSSNGIRYEDRAGNQLADTLNPVS